MKRIVSSLFVLTLIFSTLLFAQDKKAGDNVTRDGVFIHIKSGYDNPHSVVMALKMATMMADDKDVFVYLDIKAVEIVLKHNKDVTYPTFPSARESIKLLQDKGITICVCPGCLKAAGKSAGDIMPGVEIAQKDKFFGFTKGRILTLDY